MSGDLLLRIAVTTLLLFSFCLASDHHRLQLRETTSTVPQSYLLRGRALQSSKTAPTSAESCEQIYAGATWGPIRIGFDMVDVDNVDSKIVDLVSQKLMPKAIAYLSSVLQVRQAAQPLKLARSTSDCRRYSFDTEWHCSSQTAATCGSITVPDKYLQSARTCNERCAPSKRCSGACINLDINSCSCDMDAWLAQGDSYCCSLQPGPDCPEGCSLESATVVGSGSDREFVCEGSCTVSPEGEGAVGEDVHLFVTIEDTPDCTQMTQAYATWCVKDQCDRPIFARLNWCLSKLSLDTTQVDDQVTVALHEMIHAMVFSPSLFKYFRNTDGTPMMARDPTDQDAFPNALRYSCGTTENGGLSSSWGSGNYYFADVSPAIVAINDERGFGSCSCPLGRAPGNSCFVAPDPSYRLPSCVMRMSTPTVLAEVRDFFNCSSLPGAEVENQDSTPCVVIGGHWEQRVFAGEVMSTVKSDNIPTYLSRVTLALFQDSGWYKADLSKADTLTKNVHWGYKQGCDFATKRCVSDGISVSKRHFCTKEGQKVCSLDRTQVLMCSLAELSSRPPTVFDYFGDTHTGTFAEMDYCPVYGIDLANRHCTNLSTASTVPYSNVNFMRELFGTQSRCLESTLHGDVRATGDGVYPADSALFADVYPVCYEIVCDDGGRSYSVIVNASDSRRSLGTCFTAGQTLTMSGLRGSVVCAPPAEICQVGAPLHTQGAVATTEAVASTTAAYTTTTKSTSLPMPSPSPQPSPLPSPAPIPSPPPLPPPYPVPLPSQSPSPTPSPLPSTSTPLPSQTSIPYLSPLPLPSPSLLPSPSMPFSPLPSPPPSLVLAPSSLPSPPPDATLPSPNPLPLLLPSPLPSPSPRPVPVPSPASLSPLSSSQTLPSPSRNNGPLSEVDRGCHSTVAWVATTALLLTYSAYLYM